MKGRCLDGGFFVLARPAIESRSGVSSADESAAYCEEQRRKRDGKLYNRSFEWRVEEEEAEKGCKAPKGCQIIRL